jgi:hypothetical protein
MLWASRSLRPGLRPMKTDAGGRGCPLSGQRKPWWMGGGGGAGGTASQSLNGDNDCNKNINDDDDTNKESPMMALTFQKLRSMLHRTIADQALSLWDALGHCRSN